MMLRTFATLVLLGCAASHAADAQSGIALVLGVKGKVEARGAAGATRPLERRSPIYLSDVIVVDALSKAQLRFTDGTLITLAENTTFQVDQYKSTGSSDDEMSARLQRGSMRALPGTIDSAKSKSLTISSPVAVMGVVGTLLSAVSSQEGMSVGFFQGRGFLKNESSKVALGQQEKYDFAVQSQDQGKGLKALLSEPNALAALEHKLLLGDALEQSSVSAALQEAAATRPLTRADLQAVKLAIQKGGRFGNQAILKNRDRQVEFRAEGIDCH